MSRRYRRRGPFAVAALVAELMLVARIERTRFRLMRIVSAVAFMIFGRRNDWRREHRQTNQRRHQNLFRFHGRYLYPRRSIKDAIRSISRTAFNAYDLHNIEYEIGKFGIHRFGSGKRKRQRGEEVNACSG